MVQAKQVNFLHIQLLVFCKKKQQQQGIYVEGPGISP